MTAQGASAGAGDIPALLHRIEGRYNGAQSLKLTFSEVYSTSRRPAQTESGTLYLRKPGRMRWEYAEPAGKVFLSDGKETYLYTPEDRRVEKAKLKETDDMRAPLAFLLGKLDFLRDFRSFESRPEGDAVWVVANPKSQNLAYTKVEFLATAEGAIRRVRVTGQDQSKLDFTFTGEQVNAPVGADMFVFHAPAGAEIVEAEQ